MFHQPISPDPASPEAQTATGILSPVQRQVVMLAACDAPGTACPGGTLRRLADTLFGVRRANRLADPRLGALRRFCVGRRARCTAERRAAVLAECERHGITAHELAAAGALSDLTASHLKGAWA